METFRVNLCFETSEHSAQIGDDKKKTTLQLTLALYIFKLALDFNSIIISNQMKFHLAINTDSFLQIQYGFYRHALQIHNQ